MSVSRQRTGGWRSGGWRSDGRREACGRVILVVNDAIDLVPDALDRTGGNQENSRLNCARVAR